jgi:ribosomal protein S18 acetylase RimI-like enzyme
LVYAVACEIFGAALVPQSRIEAEDWSLSGVVVIDGVTAGVVLTRDEWISDLWILEPHRGLGLGRALLSQGEMEIAARGYRAFRLRVAQSNTSAVLFYEHMGWRMERAFPHESLPITMLEMTKAASS